MSIDTSSGHPAMDYAEHRRTYSSFIRGTIAIIASVASVLFLMLIFLV